MATDKKWVKLGFWLLGLTGVTLTVAVGIRSDRDKVKQTTDADTTSSRLQHISQQVDGIGSKLDGLSRQPPSKTRQEQIGNVRKELNAALNPSGNNLLEKSQNMRDSLCGFTRQWTDEMDHREKAIQFASMGHTDNAARQMHFFFGQINAKYTKEYMEEYAHDANNLRVQLINQVPGAEDVGLDYLNPTESKTEFGEPYTTAGETQDYCEEFTKLVSALQTKLLMQPRQ